MNKEPHEFKDIQQVDFFWDKPQKGFIWDDEAKPVTRSLYRYPESVARIIYKYPDSGKLVHGSVHELPIDGSRPGGRDPNILSYDHFIPPQVEGPFLIEAPGSQGYYRHNRMLQDETNLFTKFARLNPDDREGILGFANKWGMMTKGQTEVTSPQHPDGSNPAFGRQRLRKKASEMYTKEREGVPTLPAESLAFWQREILDMGQLFKVWDRWKDGDRSSLRRFIKWPANVTGVWYSLPVWQGKDYAVPDDDVLARVPGADFGWLADNEHMSPEIFKRFKRGDLLFPAQYLLQKLVNKKIEDMEEIGLANVRPRLLMNPENDIRSYLRPSNLLSAMWLQFYQAVCGERIIERCPVCGYWEDVTDNARPSRWKGHSTCLKNMSQAKWRKKQTRPLTSLLQEKNKLRRRLHSRSLSKEIDATVDGVIRAKINAAKTIKQLQEIEREYEAILAPRKRGPKSTPVEKGS